MGAISAATAASGALATDFSLSHFILHQRTCACLSKRSTFSGYNALGTRFQGGSVRNSVGTKKLLFSSALAVCLLVASVQVSAHHGVAAYDLGKTITLTGTVTRFDWENPHVVVYLDAQEEAAPLQHWSVEFAAPLLMRRLGWSDNSMKPGDRVVGEVHPSKNGAPVGISGSATMLLKFVVNGTTLPYMHK